ncbi:MAG: hypothetical protein HY744_34015 [Deltaproteobacteria bacterium]|nr:hypothetical protein [Deltaproteobacteria bacterium]
MSAIKKCWRVGALPMLVAGLAGPAVLGGCGEGGLTGDCEANIVAKVEAFQGAVDALVKVSGEVKASIGLACYNMAKDLGGAPPEGAKGGSPSDDDVKGACAEASAKIDAAIKAGASFNIVIEGGECHVKAEAQMSCEASCSVDGSCQPGELKARCEAGQLSGECSAECKGSCTVEGGSVECQGGCSGVCQGDCAGTCEAKDGQGKCKGKCEGSCTGECSGTCEVLPPSASCSGSCKGECSVEFKAPKCEAELKPPSCNIEAECQGGCNAQGTLEAECTPPKITIEATGNVDANLTATLEKNLPAIIMVAQVQGKLIVDSAAYVGKTAVGVATALNPACLLQFGADLAGKFEAAVSASVSVSVSVEASASVSGSAGG